MSEFAAALRESVSNTSALRDDARRQGDDYGEAMLSARLTYLMGLAAEHGVELGVGDAGGGTGASR